MPATDPAIWKQKVSLDLDLLAVMALHGNLCLALRHPKNQGQSRQIIQDFITVLGNHLVALGGLTSDELAKAEHIEAEETKLHCVRDEPPDPRGAIVYNDMLGRMISIRTNAEWAEQECQLGHVEHVLGWLNSIDDHLQRARKDLRKMLQKPRRS